MKLFNSLPKYLYRGDSDPVDQRKLRATINSGLLLTNLSSGGNGREIFTRPVKESIKNHVAIGWHKTHFLSFSENKSVALRYSCAHNEVEEVDECNEHWDFAILTLDTSLFIKESINKIDAGIFVAEFLPTSKEFMPTFKVLLIDVVAYLKNIDIKEQDFEKTLENAERDKEWLILPINPFEGQYTSKLDTGCFSDKQIFRIE
jgi:hypothetical protein